MRLGDRQDLTGEKYGKLTVISENGRGKYNGYYWNCVCDCGNEAVVLGRNLKSGTTRSCGCLHTKPPVITKHGMSRTKLYHIWVAMKQRCTNKADRNYNRYGGGGIFVSECWNEFDKFAEWAFANGYIEGETDLDRTDNDGPYSPDNCRFVSHRENLLNTHRRLHDTIMGEDISLSEAAEKYGFTYMCLYHRYKRGKRGNELIEHSKVCS